VAPKPSSSDCLLQKLVSSDPKRDVIFNKMIQAQFGLDHPSCYEGSFPRARAPASSECTCGSLPGRSQGHVFLPQSPLRRWGTNEETQGLGVSSSMLVELGSRRVLPTWPFARTFCLKFIQNSLEKLLTWGF
jgi:hypothetical protein